MSLSVELRPANDADVVQLLAIAGCVQEAPHWSEAAYRAFFAGPASLETANPGPSRLLMVAEDAGRIQGFVAASALMDEVELESIAVIRESRRTGLGLRLLRTVEAWAVQQGARTMLLEVRASNLAAQRFYEHADFTRAGSRRGYYADPLEDAVLFQKRLARTRPENEL